MNDEAVKYGLVLTMLHNNARADGKDTDVVQAKVTGEPSSSGLSVTFIIKEGKAVFSNGSTEYTSFTDKQGMALAKLTDRVAETGKIVASAAHRVGDSHIPDGEIHYTFKEK